jgi:hypothetical protein
MVEPGLDLHDWSTRWQQLQDAAADEPVETLPELVRLAEQMLEERGIALDDRVAAQGDDPDFIRDFQAARDIARAAENGDPPPETVDIATAHQNLREIYEYLVAERPAP